MRPKEKKRLRRRWRFLCSRTRLISVLRRLELNSANRRIVAAVKGQNDPIKLGHFRDYLDSQTAEWNARRQRLGNRITNLNNTLGILVPATLGIALFILEKRPPHGFGAWVLMALGSLPALLLFLGFLVYQRNKTDHLALDPIQFVETSKPLSEKDFRKNTLMIDFLGLYSNSRYLIERHKKLARYYYFIPITTALQFISLGCLLALTEPKPSEQPRSTERAKPTSCVPKDSLWQTLATEIHKPIDQSSILSDLKSCRKKNQSKEGQDRSPDLRNNHQNRK